MLGAAAATYGASASAVARHDPATTPEAMATKSDEAVRRLMTFLEDRDILTVTDYMEPALLTGLRSGIICWTSENGKAIVWIQTVR